MDPNATYNRLQEARTLGNLEEAIDAAYDLTTWIGKGGFPPSNCTAAELSEAIADVFESCINVCAA